MRCQKVRGNVLALAREEVVAKAEREATDGVEKREAVAYARTAESKLAISRESHAIQSTAPNAGQK
ncbi:MAG: hypothetical protein RDU01_05005 [Thermodesulfovibrionales bacterium]|nr:hypothetical protein [Thermodesulfovibrionales bacterium]